MSKSESKLRFKIAEELRAELMKTVKTSNDDIVYHETLDVAKAISKVVIAGAKHE